MSRPLLSIVIPVGPNDGADAGLLDLATGHDHVETIVSADAARPAGLPGRIRWVQGPAGRGRQVNRGARAAQGDWLWFLHADCCLGQGGMEAALAFAGRNEPALGYGRLRFRDDGPRLTRLNAVGAALRSRFLHLPYGDQGLCMPAEWFARLDGFREHLERGEDLDFVVRARKSGLPIRPMNITVYTSARRYREHGWLKTTWHHQLAAIRLVRDARGNRQPGP